MITNFIISDLYIYKKKTTKKLITVHVNLYKPIIT